MAEDNEVYALPNLVTPNTPTVIDPALCDGCNMCVNVCPVDVYIPGETKGDPPIILHPDECWYCGVCVDNCHVKGAIKLHWPVQQRGAWRNKQTGEYTWGNFA